MHTFPGNESNTGSAKVCKKKIDMFSNVHKRSPMIGFLKHAIMATGINKFQLTRKIILLQRITHMQKLDMSEK